MSARELSPADVRLLDRVAGMFDAIGPTPAVPSPADLAVLAVQPIVCTTTRYRCPWCTRFSRSKRAAVVAHMARCWRNPAVRACKTCAFFQPGRVGVMDDEACLHENGPDLSGGLQEHCPLWTLRGDR